MARLSNEVNIFNFSQGLITEGSPFTSPENSVIDASNCEFNRDGSVQRRKGIDFETGYSFSNTTYSQTFYNQKAKNEYLWVSVNNDPDLALACMQVGNTIFFYDATKSALSDTVVATPYSISPFSTNSSNSERNIVSFASGEGVLFITGKYVKPHYVEYDPVANTITATEISINVRDFTGIDDGLDLDERPTSLSNSHLYNLYNQGWPSSPVLYFKDQKGSGVRISKKPHEAVYDVDNTYPANSDIYQLGIRDSADDSEAISTFSPYEIVQHRVPPNTIPPKGHFILDPFTQDRGGVSGLGVSGNSTTKRPTSVGFFSSRAWWGFENKIFFSRIITSPDDAGDCYQKQDPTSRDFNELFDDDGGEIKLPDADEIVNLVPFGNSIVVMANNGVWQVSGPEDGGFSAKSFAIKKITNIGVASPRSVVVGKGSILYWSEDNITLLERNDVSFLLSERDITKDTIQSTFNDITNAAKRYVKGVYEPREDKVYWVYNSDSGFDGTFPVHEYDSALILDVNTGAFYTYSFSSLASDSPVITGIIRSFSRATQDAVYDVLSNDGADDVVIGSDDVVTTQSIPSSINTNIKYATFQNTGVDNYALTFSDIGSTTFMDWYTADTTGVDYTSYIQTSHQLSKSVIRGKKTLYIFCYFKQTETGLDANGDLLNPSSCTMQARWDFADNSSSNLFTSIGEVYRLPRIYYSSAPSSFSYGQEVVETKNKVRGRGKAVSLRFTSTQGKDFILYGIGAPFTISESAA